MGFFSFGGQTKNKRFEYIPQHYNEVEERIKEQYGHTDGSVSDIERTKLRIRSGLKQKSRASSQEMKTGVRMANIRLLIIIGILLVMAYYFLTSTVFDRMIHHLVK